MNWPQSIATANQNSSLQCEGHFAALRLSLHCDWIITHESLKDLTDSSDSLAGGESKQPNYLGQSFGCLHIPGKLMQITSSFYCQWAVLLLLCWYYIQKVNNVKFIVSYLRLTSFIDILMAIYYRKDQVGKETGESYKGVKMFIALWSPWLLQSLSHRASWRCWHIDLKFQACFCG